MCGDKSWDGLPGLNILLRPVKWRAVKANGKWFLQSCHTLYCTIYYVKCNAAIYMRAAKFALTLIYHKPSLCLHGSRV